MRKPISSVSLLLCFLLISEQPVFAQATGSIDLSSHFANFGRSIAQTDKFRPLHLRYLGYDNLKQDFKLLLDKGDTKKEDLENKAYIEENTQTLLRYFLIGLSLPNDKFWVNLRPDSPDNILDPDLERTDIGKIFLEADLQLKKDTASFTSPQTPEGKAYWDKLYKKAGELFGTENLTIPTITRPWIVPNEIIIRESADDAYIYKATLKVMLEEDYLQSHTYEVREPHLVGVESVHSFSDPRLKELNQYSTQLIKEQIIPKLTYEVNTSKRYAPLRQVYYSLILAQWFKQRFKGRFSESSSLFGRTVPDIDSRDLTNLTCKEPYDKQTYFRQYQKSFQDGEYNLSEPVYTPFGQSVRQYMSGGMGPFNNLVNVPLGTNSPTTTSIPGITSSPLIRRIGRKILPYLLALSIIWTNTGCIIEDASIKVSLKPPIAGPEDKEKFPAGREELLKLMITKRYTDRDDPTQYYYGLKVPQKFMEENKDEIAELFLEIAEGKFSLENFKVPGTEDEAGIKDEMVLGYFPVLVSSYGSFRRAIINRGGVSRLTTALNLEERREGVLSMVLGELLLYPEEIRYEELEQTIKRLLDSNVFFPLLNVMIMSEDNNAKKKIAELVVSSRKIPALLELAKQTTNKESEPARELLKYLLKVSPDNLKEEEKRAIKDVFSSKKEKAPDARGVSEFTEPNKSTVLPFADSPLGGIDFTHLPIVTQAITNLGSSPLKPSSYLSLGQLNLSEEYQAIERLASSSITPSPERLMSFLQASCLQDKLGEDKDKALGLLSEVLRDEESSLRPLEPGLRDILIVLESATSPQQLKEIFLGKGI